MAKGSNAPRQRHVPRQGSGETSTLEGAIPAWERSLRARNRSPKLRRSDPTATAPGCSRPSSRRTACQLRWPS